MTKTELIARVVAETKLKKDVAEKAINSFIKVIFGTLKTQGRLALAGLGTFMVKQRKAREGRDFQTGSRIEIPATKVIKFKTSKQLTKVVNYHFYSSANFIPVGESPILTLTQPIDMKVKKQLLILLKEISAELAKSDIKVPYSKDVIRNLIQQGQKELKKPFPKIDIIRLLILAIEISIQTVVSLKLTYKMLKQAQTLLWYPF
jgi:DNA-binding protein HU-beta